MLLTRARYVRHKFSMENLFGILDCYKTVNCVVSHQTTGEKEHEDKQHRSCCSRRRGKWWSILTRSVHHAVVRQRFVFFLTLLSPLLYFPLFSVQVVGLVYLLRSYSLWKQHIRRASRRSKHSYHCVCLLLQTVP